MKKQERESIGHAIQILHRRISRRGSDEKVIRSRNRGMSQKNLERQLREHSIDTEAIETFRNMIGLPKNS